ncbi:MAG: dATP pyrophosphohydrolase [Rhodospirillaceae bacterium]|nr:dATP pyrophosphohydrolase [Rhodospirillales bacterium]
MKVTPVLTRRDRALFVRLPDRLHAGDPLYVAPLLAQRLEMLDAARNPYFCHAEVALFLAWRHGQPVGRVSAQIDHNAVERHGPMGHFGLLAAEDDEVVAALMDAVERFLTVRGMTCVRGPFNLSINQEAGLLVEGRDTPPSMLTPHDLPHLGPALDGLGYAKARDVLAYAVPVDEAPPPLARRLAGLPAGRLTLRPFRLGDLNAEIIRALGVFNDAWRDNWGFVPLTEDEMRALAVSLRPLLDERMTCFAEIDGDPVGMIIALPDLNEAIRGLQGRLVPFGWVRLLWRLKVKGLKGARVPLMGVSRALAGSALGAAIPFAMVEAVRPHLRAQGYRRVEMSWILEDNLPMRRMAEAVGGVMSKRWRLYERALP